MTNEINLNTYSGKIFFSVVRIEARNKKKLCMEPDLWYLKKKRERNYSFNSFLVTNKHVIEGAEEVSLFLLNQKKINPSLEKQ